MSRATDYLTRARSPQACVYLVPRLNLFPTIGASPTHWYSGASERACMTHHRTAFVNFYRPDSERIKAGHKGQQHRARLTTTPIQAREHRSARHQDPVIISI